MHKITFDKIQGEKKLQKKIRPYAILRNIIIANSRSIAILHPPIITQFFKITINANSRSTRF